MQVLEDFNEEEDSYEVLTAPEDFSDVRLKMEEAGIPMVSAEVTMIPQTYVDLTKKKILKTSRKHLIFLMKMMMFRTYTITGTNNQL